MTRRLLSSADLCHAPEIWIPTLQAAYREARDLNAFPDVVRDVGLVLLIDSEIRTGGFAQYFFNPPCKYVYDTYFLLADIDRICADLLSEALRRVGLSYAIDLDPAQLPDDDDAFRIAFGRLIGAVTSARAESGTLDERFARFRERLADDYEGVDGLEALTRCWLAYDDWREPIIRRVLDHRHEFFNARF